MNQPALSFVDRILCSLKAALSSDKFSDTEIVTAIMYDNVTMCEITEAYSKLFPEHDRNVRPDTMFGQIESMLDGLRQLAQSGRHILFLMEWNQKLIPVPPVECDNVSGPQSDASPSTLNLLNERLDKMEENQNKFMRTMQEKRM